MSEMQTETSVNIKGENTQPRQWLSLDQWSESPEFQKLVEAEFQNSPLREGSENEGQDGFARREFLKLMGASVAMASAAGCIRRPQQKIVPYVKQPEEVTVGVSNYYTSSWVDGAECFGLLIKSNEGRPIKVEGNPSYPTTGGGMTARAHAHLLSLYDPERIQGPKKNLLNKEKSNRDTINIKYEELDGTIVKALKAGGVAVLTGNVSSPSLRALIGDFCQAFKAEHYTWEPMALEEVREGQKAAYGDDLVPQYRFDKAKVIVSVDADFLGTWITPAVFTHQFAKARKNPKTMNQLVSFDSTYSLTGANADVRVRIKPSQQLTVLMGLAHEIIVKKSFGKFAGNPQVKSILEPFSNVYGKLGASKEVWENLVANLIENKGKSLIVAGGTPTLTHNWKAVQVAANFLNSALGNDGSTVEAKAGLTGIKGSSKELLTLISEMKAGKVKTLIIHGTNPVYSAAGLGFAEAVKGVATVIYTGDRIDETGGMANYVVPDHHPMEAWADSETYGGVLAIQQPTIRPLYDTRSFQLSLMTWGHLAEQGSKRLREPETAYDFLRAYWKQEIYPSHGKGKVFDDFWDEVLQTGVVNPGTEKVSTERSFRIDSLSGMKALNENGLELALYPTVALRDGTLANVAWLHELPDPVTKVVWDNYASLSHATAHQLGLAVGDVVALTVGSKTLRLPVFIQPGLHDEVVAVAIGFGRTAAGKVGNKVGENAFCFAEANGNSVTYSGFKVELKKTKEKIELACTEGHHALAEMVTQDNRKIVAEATLKEYLKDEAANNHRHHLFSIWSGHQYNGHKWGMAVDLNTCTGCSACVVACQSENNISVVGKKYVLQGRIMHWLRIDRYYSGDPKDAQSVSQPVMCQHCDNAPCESVCPVAATVHSSEGLNDMVYNRCVGTRYCSNNCPYKVRRFNWFNYAKLIEKPMNMALNPDVTVRPRGVMEKCTFCTHRIKDVKIKTKLEGRKLADGDVKVACEQSCPAGAIVFGDLNNPESRVAKIFKMEPRSYGLIEEFNAAPSVRYMTKIRNNDKDSSGGSAAHHGGGHS